MDSLASDPIHISTAIEQRAVLADFFAAVRTAAKENELAVTDAKPALARLAAAIACRDNSQALRVRAMLMSLYSGGSLTADFSDLLTLDWSLRKDLCSVLLAFGHGEFGYEYLRSAFELAGDAEAHWFLGAAPDPRERLREALEFAKPGPLTEPRTLSERGVAHFLRSLFTGELINLRDALPSLDTSRAELVHGVLCDYLAGRFDFTDEDTVREHFKTAA